MSNEAEQDNSRNLAKSGRCGPDETILPTGAGLESIKNVKNNNLIIDDLVNTIYLNAGVAPNAQPVVRANAREFLNRIKDLLMIQAIQLYHQSWKQMILNL